MEAPVFHTITLAQSGETFPCGEEDESVLAAMRRANAGPIKYGCFGGGCGVCRMRVVSGSYHSFKPMSRAHVTREDQSNGIVLLCCIRPTSDLTLAPAGVQDARKLET
ncbi:MAG TPA: 2Fe-2S iron-sulfur cluster binding domain-containing protein [Eubacteriales bacterium]|nr:2Fe-2S iron-sulfur cluster binding domain-containing protein [Eubacteriales bacterium]